MHLPSPERLPAADIYLSALLFLLAALPIAIALAVHTHILVLPLWLLLWGFVIAPRSNLRTFSLIIALFIVIGCLLLVLPPPNGGFFMALVLLLSVPEQVDKNGQPNPFNLLGIIFSALCVMVLSAQLLLFIVILASVAFYIGIFILRYNNMPLSGLQIRMLSLILVLGGSLFIALFLFLVLPRFEASQLPGFAIDKAGSGVTDRLEIGQFASVIQRSETAFRAFLDRPPGDEELYWRVYVMTQIRHNMWQRGQAAAEPFTPVTLQPPTRRYEIRHARSGPDWLPVLGGPAINSAPVNTRMTYGGEIIIPDKKYRNGKNHLMFSSDKGLASARLPEVLDTGYHPRLQKWARIQRAKYTNDKDYAQFLMAHFAAGGYRYTLTPRKLQGDRIDQFFFTTKEGYCSHYAMAMASALRAANIPANIVVGYSGGSWNEFGNYVLVQQSDAHAWVEAKLDGHGWQRFDPTKFVPLLSEAESGNITATTPFSSQVDQAGQALTPIARLQLSLRWLDNVVVQLNNRIINYDQDSQNAFFAALAPKTLLSKTLAHGQMLYYGLFWIIATFMLILPFYLLRWFTNRDPLLRLDRRFEKISKRLRHPRERAEGRLHHADRLADLYPLFADDIRQFRILWCRFFFSRQQADRADLRHMSALLHRLSHSVSYKPKLKSG